MEAKSRQQFRVLWTGWFGSRLESILECGNLLVETEIVRMPDLAGLSADETEFPRPCFCRHWLAWALAWAQRSKGSSPSGDQL